MKKAIITLLVLVFPMLTLSSAFRHFTVSNGLYNNQARQIFELPNGQIMVETEGMFNLFNGVHFLPQEYNLAQVYRMPTYNGCYHYYDKEGLLWIKDFYNLYLYDTGSRQFIYDVAARLEKSGIKQRLKNFTIDSNKDAWLFTEDGSLYRYDWKEKAQLVMQLTKDELQQGITVTTVIKAGKEEFMIILNTCVVKHWHAAGKQITYVDKTLDTGKPIASHCVYSYEWDENTLLIAENNYFGGLYRYDIPTRKWTLLIQGRVNSMERTPDGKLIASSNTGIHYMDEKLENLENIVDFELVDGKLNDKAFIGAHFDRQGGLWLATFSDGVLYRQPEREKAHTISDLEKNQIRAIAKIDNDNLLYGTTKGLYVFQTQTGSFTPVPSAIGMTCVSMNTDSEERIWVATLDGICCYDRGSVTFYRSDNTEGLVHTRFLFAMELENGKYLACNLLNVLGYFYPGPHLFVPLNSKLPQLEKYRAIMGACKLKEKGKVVVYSQNGIFVLDYLKNQLEDFHPLAGMLQYSEKFNSVVTDSKDRLWIGTQNGLLMVDGAHVRRFTRADGLSNSCIQSIVEDGRNRMWIGTSFGISRITLTEKDTLITSFGPEDGMLDTEYRERAAVIAADGTAYFGGLGGLTVFKTGIFDSVQKPMAVSLVGLTVFDEEMPLDLAPLSLEYNKNYLSVQFSALNYANPQHTHYRYRLQGMDTHWLYSKDADGLGMARYNSLPPGTYSLQIQAAVADGEWGPMLTKEIRIRPPFWLSWWAYTIYLVAFLAVGTYLVNIYLRRRKAKMEKENEGRVNQLFELREEARHQFARSVNIDPKKIAINNEEEELIQKLLKIIEQNMDNTEYTVDMLSRDVGIGRTNFYRKMQSMLGITPSDFLRNVRLKRAAQLLTETELPVNQIALMVGFNTPRYFSNYFKKMFGVNPSEYQNKRSNPVE